MKSILFALTVEYWKRAGLVLFGTIAAFVVIPALFYRILLGLTLQTNALEPLTFHFSYLGVALLVFCSVGFSPQIGLRDRLFVLPLTTRFIVAWLLVMPMATVALSNLVTNLLFDYFFDVQWPLLRPTLWLALMALVLKVMYWRLLVGRARQLLLFAGILAVMAWRFVLHYYPDGFWAEIDASNSMGWLEVLAMLTVGVVAWVVGQWSIAQHRRGDASEILTATKLAEVVEIRLREITSRTVAGHASAAAAMRWYYWREGIVAGIGGGCIGACMLLFVQYHEFTSLDGNLWEATTTMMCVMPLVAGMFLGVVQGMSVRTPGRKGDQVMSSFLATKPVSNRELATSLLAISLQGCLISWLILVATAAILPTFIWLFGDIGPLRGEFQEWRLSHQLGLAAIPCVLLIALLIIWTTASVLASCAFIGRDYITAPFWPILLIAMVFIVVARERLPREMVELFQLGVLGCAVFTVVGSTVCIYAAALRRRLVSHRLAGWSLSGWMLLAIGCYFLLPWDSSYRLGTCGLTMLSFTPLAATPLALSWNRHR